MKFALCLTLVLYGTVYGDKTKDQKEPLNNPKLKRHISHISSLPTFGSFDSYDPDYFSSFGSFQTDTDSIETYNPFLFSDYYQPTITKTSQVFYSNPYPIQVEKKVIVPYEVKVKESKPAPVQITKHVPVEVPKPYPVHITKHVPVEVPKPYPVHITKHVPYPVHTPVYVKVPQPYPVPVPQPYPVPIPSSEYEVKASKPFVVEQKSVTPSTVVIEQKPVTPSTVVIEHSVTPSTIEIKPTEAVVNQHQETIDSGAIINHGSTTGVIANRNSQTTNELVESIYSTLGRLNSSEALTRDYLPPL